MAKKNSAVANYIIVALILGVITYVEFAIVEYPQAWLGPSWTMFWLITLSVVKFVMVIMYFMHLKGDDSTYSGFFSSGMFITLATFIGMTAMFLLPRAVSSTAPTDVQVGAADQQVPPEVLLLVESAGKSRTPAAQADTPPPATRSFAITPPSAANDASTYEVEVAVAEPAAAPEPEAEASAPADEPAAVESETVATEAPEPPAAAEETAVAAWDEAAGANAFNVNCVACHQANGEGIPAAFPPLASHTVDVYENGGREFLLNVVLYGLQGAIEVNGTQYNGLMPAWAQLSDDDIANVLNYTLTAWDDAPAGFQPYQASEVADQRGQDLSAVDVFDLREGLGL